MVVNFIFFVETPFFGDLFDEGPEGGGSEGLSFFISILFFSFIITLLYVSTQTYNIPGVQGTQHNAVSNLNGISWTVVLAQAAYLAVIYISNL